MSRHGEDAKLPEDHGWQALMEPVINSNSAMADAQRPLVCADT